MITILKNTEAGLQTLERPTDGCWINVVSPTSEEILQPSGTPGSSARLYHYPLTWARWRARKRKTVHADRAARPLFPGRGVGHPLHHRPGRHHPV